MASQVVESMYCFLSFIEWDPEGALVVLSLLKTY